MINFPAEVSHFGLWTLEITGMVEHREFQRKYHDNTQEWFSVASGEQTWWRSAGHWVHKGLCYAVRHCRLVCHICNANTSLGTHAKCMVIGTPCKDYTDTLLCWGAVKATKGQASLIEEQLHNIWHFLGCLTFVQEVDEQPAQMKILCPEITTSQWPFMMSPILFKV